MCESGRELSCVGGCINEIDGGEGDDLISSPYYDYFGLAVADIDRMCPRYDCDNVNEDYCLSNDEGATLADHGGIARGAKLSIFDVLDNASGIGIDLAANGMWEPAMEAGSKLHSNSWGSMTHCDLTPLDILFDDFMYNVSTK